MNKHFSGLHLIGPNTLMTTFLHMWILAIMLVAQYMEHQNRFFNVKCVQLNYQLVKSWRRMEDEELEAWKLELFIT